jgi:hypothetical protein
MNCRDLCRTVLFVLVSVFLSHLVAAQCRTTLRAGAWSSQSELKLPARIFGVKGELGISFNQSEYTVGMYCDCRPPCDLGEGQYAALSFSGTTAVFGHGILWETEVGRCELELSSGDESESRWVTLWDYLSQGSVRWVGGVSASTRGLTFSGEKVEFIVTATEYCECVARCPEKTAGSRFPVLTASPGELDLIVGETTQVTITAADANGDLLPDAISFPREAGSSGSLFDVNPPYGGGSGGTCATQVFKITIRDDPSQDLGVSLAEATLGFVARDEVGHQGDVVVPVTVWRGRPSIEHLEEESLWAGGEYRAAFRIYDPDLDQSIRSACDEVLTCEVVDVQGGTARALVPYSLVHTCSTMVDATAQGVTHVVGFTSSDEPGPQCFTIRAEDRAGHVAQRVIEVGRSPTAADDALVATTRADGASMSVSIDVLANDVDPDGDDLTGIEVVSQPASGFALVNEDLTITYTPDDGFAGVDSLTYLAIDSRGAQSNEATVTIAVLTPPIAFGALVEGHPQQASFGQTTKTLTFDLGLLARDLDCAGDPAQYGFSTSAVDRSASEKPGGAELTVIAATQEGLRGTGCDGQFVWASYTAGAALRGTLNAGDLFQYSFTVTDPDGLTSNLGSLDIRIVNNAPIGGLFLSRGIALRLGDPMLYPLEPSWYEAGCVGFSDPDDDPLRFWIVDGPRLGQVDCLPSGGGGEYAVTLLYHVDRVDALESHTTRGGTPYVDSFTVVAEDPFGATAETEVEVTIDVLNSDPVCADDEVEATMGTGIDIDVLANDTDVDGDALEIVSVTEPGFGASSFSHIMIHYEPLPDFHGDDAFAYTVSDGYEGTDAATVTVHIVDGEPPVFWSGPGDIGPLANQAGLCAAAATWIAPVVGTDVTDNVEVTSLTCTHSPGDPFPVGETRVVYTAADPCGNEAQWSFTVTVEDRESPEIAGMPSDTCVEVGDGEGETVVSWTEPTASDNCALLALVGTHAPGDTFPLGDTVVTYTATDVHGNATLELFTVTVAPPWHIACSDVSLSTDDPAGRTVPFESPVSGGCGVSVTFDPPSGSFFPVGDTLVSCEATDGSRTEVCTFSVSIEFTNHAPNAVNDVAQMADGEIVIQVDVLANDSDPDGHAIEIQSVGPPCPCGATWIDGDTVRFLADGCQPFLGGTATFSYKIADVYGEEDTATVAVKLPSSGMMPETEPPPEEER